MDLKLKEMVALIKRSPETAAFVRRELAKRAAPEPADLNARILASRKPETTEQRAARLTGHFGVAKPVSAAPAESRVAAAGDVAPAPSIVDRIINRKQGA